MLSTINQNYGSAYGQGVKGATSGTDVFALAANMAYGKNNAISDLNVRNAQGKEQAFGAMLSANEKAGQEYVNKNAYDRGLYQAQMRAKGALTQAGAENTYSAFDQIAGTASKYLLSGSGNNKPEKPDNSGAADPTSYGNAGVNPVSNAPMLSMGTLDSTYDKYYYPDGSPRYDINGNPIPQAS